MIMFFDYVYYRVCKAYYHTRDSSPRIAGLCVISVVCFFNLLSLFCLYSIFIREDIYINKLWAIPAGLTIIILNGIRYNKLHYGILERKWKEDAKKTYFMKGVIAFLYIILSLVIGIGLAIYVGEQNW